MCSSGYDTIKGRAMTTDELKSALVKLAKLHAVSFVLAQTENTAPMVSHYQQGIFFNDQVLKNDVMYGGYDQFVELLKQHEQLKVYLPKFENLKEQVLEGCKNLYRSYNNGERQDIFVLNHGDFHIKNLLFKFNRQMECEDVMMASRKWQLKFGIRKIYDSIHKLNY